MKRAFLIVFSVFWVTNLQAQDVASLVTDRPDMTESAVTVKSGNLQIESGFHFEKDQQNGTDMYVRNFNSTLLRYGLLDRLEFRMGLGYSSQTFASETLEGMDPVSLGFKFQIAQQSGVLPQMAILNTFVPDFTGSRNFRPDSWTGEFLGALAWESGSVGLGMNVGASFDSQMEGALFPYSAAAGFPLSESLGGFLELFGTVAESHGPAHSGNLGITWLLNPDFQLDAYYGFGLNNRAVDYSAGFGLSYRFDV
jgi:hypothetical protein